MFTSTYIPFQIVNKNVQFSVLLLYLVSTLLCLEVLPSARGFCDLSLL